MKNFVRKFSKFPKIIFFRKFSKNIFLFQIKTLTFANFLKRHKISDEKI